MSKLNLQWIKNNKCGRRVRPAKDTKCEWSKADMLQSYSQGHVTLIHLFYNTIFLRSISFISI